MLEVQFSESEGQEIFDPINKERQGLNEFFALTLIISCQDCGLLENVENLKNKVVSWLLFMYLCVLKPKEESLDHNDQLLKVE